MEDRIYYLKDQKEDFADWVIGLNASGYAGIDRKGTLVDRREFPEAVPVKKNSFFGVAEPKDLPNEGR